jgi:hypothetical protein
MMCALLLLVVSAPAQETTGSMQGTVTDPSGAVVPGAHLTLTGTTLIGSKEADSDAQGQYHFANLPPGVYSIKVMAKGFEVLQRGNLAVQVGQLPVINLQLQLGSATSTIEVTTAAPLIDTTTTQNMTDLSNETLSNVPHGLSFQSVIQFAPMARNEPLAGGSAGMSGNSGGSLPGSAGNGLAVGFSIGGAADSESSYLVDGQDTENVSGGASNANVPFPFIQEVQVKTSGVQAEYGGALGGVINVITKKGGNEFHGNLFTSYESDALDGSTNATLRYIPSGGGFPDADSQSYSPKKDHFRINQPGFTIGGPVVKDRLWFFLGFAPYFSSRARTVDFSPSLLTENQSLGNQVFNEDTQQYFSTARLDFAATQKIRLYASWLYQYERASGVSLPDADSIASQGYPNFPNETINSPITEYSHGLGYANPNATYNFGADITLTPTIVATTRFGYFFNNYHDIGWPTQGVDLNFQSSGVDANNQPLPDNTDNPLPTALALPVGATTAPYDSSYTLVNASKHYQFNQDVQFFKSGWWGTHNIKVGYEFNRLENVIDQNGNLPLVFAYVGQGQSYGASTAFGGANCDTLAEQWGGCTGQYGYVTIQDFATILKNDAGKLVPAIDNNHALFAQDAWTIGHGFTFNLGLRIEKENLPAPPGIGIADIKTINFPWSDKIEPRLGVAWGSRDGKIKIFGSYGVVNDVMKLLLAQTSFGAQGYEDCSYPLGPNGTSAGFTNADLASLVFNAGGRACPTGVSNVGANFSGGSVPAVLQDSSTGVSLIENVNYRPEEPVAPNVKPYRQHEYTAGVDYALGNVWALEVRYDRRRLDHVIEDASLADPNAFEIYTIVNPGQGVNKTIDGYANYLTSIGDAYGPGTAAFNADGSFGTCPTCPNNPQAVRNYDGLEVRLTKRMSNNWAGNFSYTWSSLWGNYTGLTTTDQTDGGITGRDSPDTTRAFDEPFYYFKYNGKSANGPLPTDRPNTLKGDVYYNLHWMGMTSTLGLFQVAYQGTPVSSWSDVGLGCCSQPIEGTYIWGRGNFVNATSDAEGNLVLGNTYARRTPWYTQTDLSLQHAIHVNKNNEAQVLTFSANFTNLFNQHSVTAYWAGLNSIYYASAPFQYQIFSGAAFYQTVETGYNPQTAFTDAGVPLNSFYGKPNHWQQSRTIRLGVTFDF